MLSRCATGRGTLAWVEPALAHGSFDWLERPLFFMVIVSCPPLGHLS
jgi:hypothetical protein